MADTCTATCCPEFAGTPHTCLLPVGHAESHRFSCGAGGGQFTWPTKAEVDQQRLTAQEERDRGAHAFACLTPVERALSLAIDHGSNDGGHHLRWVIDQMVRALTECPLERVDQHDAAGRPWSYQRQGESAAYLELVRAAKDGEDGPDTYEWDEGTPP